MTTVDQWIDITNVSPGQLSPAHDGRRTDWSAESNELNNVTWVDLQLKAKGPPRVVAYGPSA